MLKFECPDCGNDRLQEVSKSVVMVHEILELKENYDFEFGRQSCGAYGTISHYECTECLYIPKYNYYESKLKVNDPQILIRWLKEKEK